MAMAAVLSVKSTLQARDRLLQLIAEESRLIPEEPRDFEKPFKPGEIARTRPQPGSATLVLGDRTIGAIELPDDYLETGEVLVYSPNPRDPELRAYVSTLCKELDATAVWFEDL